MTELGVVRRKVKRAERAAVEALGRYGVATVHEAMGRVGLMKTYMRPIYPGALVSVERGHDPQEFSLIAFGGAGRPRTRGAPEP